MSLPPLASVRQESDCDFVWLLTSYILKFRLHDSTFQPLENARLFFSTSGKIKMHLCPSGACKKLPNPMEGSTPVKPVHCWPISSCTDVIWSECLARGHATGKCRGGETIFLTLPNNFPQCLRILGQIYEEAVPSRFSKQVCDWKNTFNPQD